MLLAFVIDRRLKLPSAVKWAPAMSVGFGAWPNWNHFPVPEYSIDFTVAAPRVSSAASRVPVGLVHFSADTPSNSPDDRHLPLSLILVAGTTPPPVYSFARFRRRHRRRPWHDASTRNHSAKRFEITRLGPGAQDHRFPSTMTAETRRATTRSLLFDPFCTLPSTSNTGDRYRRAVCMGSGVAMQ